MACKDTGLRMAAATFALGLALAGPQAAGVATADRGDTDGTAASAADDSDNSRDGGDEFSASAEKVDTAEDPATQDAVEHVTEDIADETVEVEDSGGDTVAEDASETDDGASPDHEYPGDSGDMVDEPPAGEPEEPAEPVEFVDPKAPDDAGALPETGDETGAEAGEAGDGKNIVEPVSLPGRGGPDPLPWWRTTTGTDGAEDLPSEPWQLEGATPSDPPVWLYSTPGNPVFGPELPQVADTGTANVPDQAINSLQVAIASVIDQVVEWLNGLPANPFTEFLSGALLLLRRALVPETPMGTDGPGNSISDPEAEIEIPRGLIGLTEDEALQAAVGAGWTARIVSRDGEDFMITKDYRLDRVNFTVVDGAVTAVYMG